MDGATENSLVKHLVKYFGSLKPTSYAISETFMSPDCPLLIISFATFSL